MQGLFAIGTVLKFESFTSKKGEPFVTLRLLCEDDVIEALGNGAAIMEARGGSAVEKGETVAARVSASVRGGSVSYWLEELVEVPASLKAVKAS